MTIRPSARDLAEATRATAEQLKSVQVPGLEYFAAQPARGPDPATEQAHESALAQMFAYYG